HDALTELANRVLLNARLEQTLGREEMVAVHHLDLDQFKAVNDTFGHHAGDKLLKIVAERLCGLVRDTDTIARMGGDEFVIVQTPIADPADATSLAQRVIKGLSEPYAIDGQQAVIGASVGISVGPGDGTTPDTLLRNADLALYRAKGARRGAGPARRRGRRRRRRRRPHRAACAARASRAGRRAAAASARRRR